MKYKEVESPWIFRKYMIIVSKVKASGKKILLLLLFLYFLPIHYYHHNYNSMPEKSLDSETLVPHNPNSNSGKIF